MKVNNVLQFFEKEFDAGNKENAIQLVKLMNNVCNQQNEKIKELEAKIHLLNEQSQNNYEKYINVLKENQQLKQQLHDLPKKIVEDVTNELSNNTSLYFEMRESTSAHCPNKEYEWFNYVRFRNYINAILKKYGG